MPWSHVTVPAKNDPAYADVVKTLEGCATCFRNVSKDSDGLDEAKLEVRISATLDERFPRPKLADGTTDDLESQMFRLYRFSTELKPEETLLTIALDRTLCRDWSGATIKGTPLRNHWCITLGIGIPKDLAAPDLTLDETASIVLELFHPDIALVPRSYRLALLWHARRQSADQEITPDPGDWSNLKHRADMVYRKLNNDSKIVYLQHAAADAPSERTYAHWASCLGVGALIRFVPIAVVQ